MLRRQKNLLAVLAVGALSAGCSQSYRPYDTLNYDECYSAPPGYVLDREKYSPVPECWVFNTRRPAPKTALTGGGAGGVSAGSPGQPGSPSNPGAPKPAPETPQFSSTGDGALSAEGREFSAAGNAAGGADERGAIASDERNTSDTTRDLNQEVRDTIDSIRSGVGN
jgi:hypothetical protein